MSHYIELYRVFDCTCTVERPTKYMICYMCGEIEYKEARCPNTICRRCGNKTEVYMNSCIPQNRPLCGICKFRHSSDYCPEMWF